MNGTQETDSIPDQQMWNSTVVVTTRGRLDARVKYGHMARFSEKKMALFDDGIMVDFYNENGEHASTLTADRGQLDEEDNDVKAMGNVIVRSDSGVTLFTEEISYLQQQDRIVSQVDVKIATSNGDTLYGVGFESDPQLKAWSIQRVFGRAHKGVDLSTDRWQRGPAADSLTADSLTAEPAVPSGAPFSANAAARAADAADGAAAVPGAGNSDVEPVP